MADHRRVCRGGLGLRSEVSVRKHVIAALGLAAVTAVAWRLFVYDPYWEAAKKGVLSEVGAPAQFSNVEMVDREGFKVVKAQVSSQNQLGETVQHGFVATVRYRGGGKYELTRLVFTY